MSDSVRPHRRQPARLRHPWDSPGKNTGVGCHFLLQCMKVKSESEVTRVRLLATPWTAAYQAPPSMGLSKQEYWSGVPLPSLILFCYSEIMISKRCQMSTKQLILLETSNDSHAGGSGSIRKIPWMRKWHPTPVLLPGKSHGQRSLVGCSPWGREESDTTEAT